MRFWYLDLTLLIFDLMSSLGLMDDEDDAPSLLLGKLLVAVLERLLELLAMLLVFSAYFRSFSKLLNSLCWNCYFIRF